ncbi:hypothetical protein [Streptomyces sp. HNM0575]|uniref:hypothetical protein n=1 Tax=Streptomyces sp. HNM0575 TaxID=2716338 RepID=UPI0019D1D3DD|nr:hypothetical protein [Streptomyces sp. HNM0575]
MTTAIAVTSHGHMLPPPDRNTPRAHVFQPPDEQPFDVALAQTQRLIEQHGHLVVVHPTTLGKTFLHRLHAIRSVLETDRIALMPTSLPPLGTAVLVRQLRQLSRCEFSPGVLGASVRLLAHYIYAGAQLNSVAKLDHVPVSLTANAKSWNPRAQFAVLAAPTPQLVRTDGGGSSGNGGGSGGSGGGGGGAHGAPGAGAAIRATLTGPQFPTHLTVAHGQLNSDWVSSSLAPQWQVGGVHETYLPDESARWWGTGRLIEFAAAIPDVSVLYRLVSSVRRDECHWCGLELIGDRCAFCAAPAPHGHGGRGTAAARPAPARPASRTGSGGGSGPGSGPGAAREGGGRRGGIPGRGGAGLAAFLKQKHTAAAERSDSQSRHAVVADPRGL